MKFDIYKNMIEKKTSVTFGLNMENRNNWIHQYNTNHPKLTPLYTSRFISGYNLPIQGFFRYKNPGKKHHLDVNTSNYRDTLSVYYLVCSLSNKEKQLLGSTCNPADVGYQGSMNIFKKTYRPHVYIHQNLVRRH